MADIDSDLLQSLSDPQLRSQLRAILDRIEDAEGDISDLVGDVAKAETEREQTREMARSAQDRAGRVDARLKRLQAQLHYGKDKRKQILLLEAESRAGERENGRGRLLVSEAQSILREYTDLSKQTVREYLSELARDYRGVQYRQATEPKYRGRNVKALYLRYDEFWEHHDLDDVVEG